MAKRKATKKKAATRKRTTTKKTSRKSTKRTSNSSTAGLDTAYAQGFSEVAAINDALSQAQSAQESLAEAYEQLRLMEEQLNEEHEEVLAGLESEREELREALITAQAEDDRHTKDLNGVLKSLRGLASSLGGMNDPLLPYSDEDDDGDIPVFKTQLTGLVDKKSGTLDSLPAVQDALQAARDLSEVIAGRIKLQSNRMKSARKDIEQFEQDCAQLESDVDSYASQQEQLQEQLADAEVTIQEAENNIQQLQDDLESSQARCVSLEEQQAESDEQNAAEQEALQQEVENAIGRADELGKKLKDSRELARKTERATVDLAEIVLGLADADIAMGQLADAPPMTIARDELESLIGDAGDDWDDEVDNLFRDDLGDDIAGAARNVGDSLVVRRKALVTAVEKGAAQNASLTERCESQVQNIGDLESSMQDMESALNRSTAQLQSVTEEVEHLSAELTERHKELNEAHGEIARMTTTNESLGEKAILAQQLQGDLKSTISDLNATQKALDKLTAKSEACDLEQRRLARSLVDLAGAAESALAISGGGKGQSRFTKTYKKLDDVAAQNDNDTARVLKSSLEVVDKLSTRVSQITHELNQKNETLEDLEKYSEDLEKQLASESSTLSDRETTLKTLKLDNQELNKTAKHAAKLEDQLAKTKAEAASLSSELQDTKARLEDTEADLEEALAREEESRDSLSSELSEVKRRLTDEQKTRRATEMSISDDRDDYEGQITTLQTTIEELTKNLEERDDHIIELQSELDDAGEQRARIAELEHRADTFKADLDESLARNRQLEGELDNQEAVETLEEELREAHDERDDLITKVRELEKKLADEKGVAASMKSMNATLNKKLDDKGNQHRRELDKLQERYDAAVEENRRNKVKLAGMSARRTTSGGRRTTSGG